MSSLLQFGLINAVLVAALALVVALIDWRVRRPALIHALWLLVLAKLVTPPLLDVPLPAPTDALRVERAGANVPAMRLAGSAEAFADRSGPRVQGGVPRADTAAMPGDASERFAAGGWLSRTATRLSGWAHRPVNALRGALDVHSPWLPWLLYCVWGGGAIAWFARQAVCVRRFHARISQSAPAPSAIQQQTLRLANEMGLVRCPEVVIVPEMISPMLWGLGLRTRLVFPAGLLARLDRQSCSTLLAHELAHFGRGDHWVRALELIVTGLFWWNPVVWWARRRIEAAEEECCDAWVVSRFPDTPRVYAEALLATIDFLAETPHALPATATGLGQVPFLRRRLIQIMRGVAPRALTWRGRLAVLALAAALLPTHPEFTNASAVRSASGTAATLEQQVIEPGVIKAFRAAPPQRELSLPERPLAIPTAEPPVQPEIERVERVRTAPAGPEPDDWAVALSPDGRFSVTREARGRLLLFDELARRMFDLSGAQIACVAFSRDGMRLASGCEDGTVRIWNCETGQVAATLTGHTRPVRSVAFTPDGASVISGCAEGELIVWNCDTQRRTTSTRLRQFPVNSLAIDHAGEHVALAAGGVQSPSASRVSVRRVRDLEERWVFESDAPVGAVAFHEDRRSLVAGEWTGRVTLYDLESKRTAGGGLLSREDILAARFSADTQKLTHVDPQRLKAPRSPGDPEPTRDGVARELLSDARPQDAQGSPAPTPVRTNLR